MASPSPDDELLSILLTNLRNAAATFGEGTPPYESIRTTIEEHVNAMKASGIKASVSSVRKTGAVQSNTGQSTQTAMSFSNLAFRPKPNN